MMNLTCIAALDGVTPEIVDNGFTKAVIFPVGPAVDLRSWLTQHRDHLRGLLRDHGCLLLRAAADDIESFGAAVKTFGGGMLEYTERSTPRTAVSGNIYTSTDYPADQPILLHNENSYSDRWPERLHFYCDVVPAVGGATPIADSRAVLSLLPADVRKRFAAGVEYTRSYRDGLGLSWQEAFQAEDRGSVEAYCAGHGIEFEWAGDELRTRHRRPATQRDPHSGAEVWFNQAHLFHFSSLEPEVSEVLLELYGEDGLPRNARFGDGQPIPAADLAAVRDAYSRASLTVPWQRGDILTIDNMLMAHGREPYSGPRRILVAMT